jgi:Mor family transcriptional regulator
MSKTTAGIEFLADINITIMHALCKKGLDYIKAEKIAIDVKDAIRAHFPGQNLYFPNLKNMSTEARKIQIINLYDEGKTVREIVRLTGLGCSVIYEHIRNRNKIVLDLKGLNGVENTNLAEIKLYSAKVLLREKIDPATCKEVIEALCSFIQKNWTGITFSWPGTLTTKQKRAQAVYEDYKQGMPRAELAIKYNLRREAVKSIIRRMKINSDREEIAS